MTRLESFPLPKRDYVRTDSYRMVRASSYRQICRLIFVLLSLQLLTIGLLLAEVVR